MYLSKPTCSPREILNISPMYYVSFIGFGLKGFNPLLLRNSQEFDTVMVNFPALAVSGIFLIPPRNPSDTLLPFLGSGFPYRIYQPKKGYPYCNMVTGLPSHRSMFHFGPSRSMSDSPYPVLVNLPPPISTSSDNYCAKHCLQIRIMGTIG